MTSNQLAVLAVVTPSTSQPLARPPTKALTSSTRRATLFRPFHDLRSARWQKSPPRPRPLSSYSTRALQRPLRSARTPLATDRRLAKPRLRRTAPTQQNLFPPYSPTLYDFKTRPTVQPGKLQRETRWPSYGSVIGSLLRIISLMPVNGLLHRPMPNSSVMAMR